jgi:hypothetical protein
MRTENTDRLPRGAEQWGVGPGFRASTAALLVLFMFLCAGAPILDAQEEAAEQLTEEAKTDDENTEGKKKGPSFIPIPIFITEPAIGYGLGAAVGYFHKKKDEADSEAESLAPAFTADSGSKAGRRQKAPPTISGVAAAYTEKGTWGVGLGHSASWKKDTIRYAGAIGYANIVSTFYFGDQPFDFTLETPLLIQNLKFRIGDSDFFVGGKLVYFSPELVFDEDRSDIPFEYPEIKVTDFGLALQSDYDGRDNKMTPNRGQFVEFVAWKHLEVLGGETDYWKLGLQAQTFHEMMDKKLVLGFHLDLDTAGGDPPFWGYPWITMRGIPALRYQNESAAVLETELRWNILERWAAVGFVGVGATRGDLPIYRDESGIVAGGIGGRFLFRPQDSLWVGIDVAKGPEDYVLYIQVGQAW